MTTSIRKPLRELHANNYHTLITDDSSPSVSMRAARLFWVTRFGRPVQRAWNEMTLSEKSNQIQAERRAADIALNDPCAMGGY